MAAYVSTTSTSILPEGFCAAFEKHCTVYSDKEMLEDALSCCCERQKEIEEQIVRVARNTLSEFDWRDNARWSIMIALGYPFFDFFFLDKGKKNMLQVTERLCARVMDKALGYWSRGPEEHMGRVCTDFNALDHNVTIAFFSKIEAQGLTLGRLSTDFDPTSTTCTTAPSSPSYEERRDWDELIDALADSIPHSAPGSPSDTLADLEMPSANETLYDRVLPSWYEKRESYTAYSSDEEF